MVADEEVNIRRHRQPQVERVLCGPLHRNVFARCGGTLVSVCPSTGWQLRLSPAPDAPLLLRPDAAACPAGAVKATPPCAPAGVV